MKGTNFLAVFADWIGEVFERLNPSMYRMVSTSAPYLTPLPVAWLTAHNAAQFLGFSPQISVVFVVILEFLGLWSTTELVDSFVEAVRSRNLKSWAIVVFLLAIVIAYLRIVINLNVNIEMAVGNVNPLKSQVITLICYLPFIGGSLNGYRKVKMETKTQVQLDKEYKEKIEEKIRQENNAFKLEKYRIKHGSSGSISESGKSSGTTSRSTNGNFHNTSRNNNGSSKMGRPSVHQERVYSYMEEMISRNGEPPTFTEVARDLQLPQSTASRLRKDYLENK